MNPLILFGAISHVLMLAFQHYSALQHRAIESTIKLISAPSPAVDFLSLSLPADDFVFPGASFGDFSAADFAMEAHSITFSTTFSPNSTATRTHPFSPVDMPQSTFEAVRRDSFAADNALLAACVVLAVGLSIVFFGFVLGIKKGARSFLCLSEQQQSSSVDTAAFGRLYITIEPPFNDAEIELERARARRQELRSAEHAERKREKELAREERFAQDNVDEPQRRLLAPRRGFIGNENRISRREAAAKAAAAELAETQAEPLEEPVAELFLLDPARRRELLAISGATGDEDRMFRRETAARAEVVEPVETQADLLAESLPAYRGSIFQEHASLIPDQESEPETGSDVSSALVPEPASPELEVTTPTQDAPLRDISGDWLSSMPGGFPGLSLSPEKEASSEASREEDIEQEDQEVSRAPTPALESTSAEEEAVQTSRDQEPTELSPTLAPSQDPKDSFEPSEPEVAPSDALPAEVEAENPTQLSGSETPAGTTASDDGTFESLKATEDVFDETSEDVKSQTATPKRDDADIMSGGPSYDRQPGTTTPEAEAEESSGSSGVNASLGTKVKEDKKVHFAGDNLQQPVAEAENEQASIKDSSNDVEGTAGQLPTLESASPRKRKTPSDDTSSNNVVIVGSVDESMIDEALSPKRQKQKHISANQGIDEHETQPADSPTESSTSNLYTQTQLLQHAADLRVKERVSARRQRRGTTRFRQSLRNLRFSPIRASPPTSGRRGPSKSEVESHEINELMHARLFSVHRSPSESQNDSDEEDSEADDAVLLDLGDSEPDYDYHNHDPDFDTDVHEITLGLADATIEDVVHNGGGSDGLNAPRDTDVLKATSEKSGHDANTVRPRLVEPLDRDGNEPMSDPVNGDDDDITQPGVGGASPFNSTPQHQDVQVADQGAVANASGDVDMDEDQASVPSNSRSDVVNHRAPSSFTNPQADGFPTMPNKAFAPAASNAFTPRSNPFASVSNAPMTNPFTPSPNPSTPSPSPFAPRSNAFTSVSNSSVLGSQPPANPLQSPSATQLSASNQPPSQAGPKMRPLPAGKGEQPKQALTGAPKRNIPTPLPGLFSLAQASQQQPTFSGSQPPINGPSAFSWQGQAPPAQQQHQQQQPTFSGSQSPMNNGSSFTMAPSSAPQQPTSSGIQPQRNNGSLFSMAPSSAPQQQQQPQPASIGIQPQRNNGSSFSMATPPAPPQQPTFSGIQPPMNSGSSFRFSNFSAPGMNPTPPLNANTVQAPAANTADRTTQPRFDFPPTAKTIIEPPQKSMGQASQPSVSESEYQNALNTDPARQSTADKPAWQTSFPTVANLEMTHERLEVLRHSKSVRSH